MKACCHKLTEHTCQLSEVLTAVGVCISVFWYVMACSFVDRYEFYILLTVHLGTILVNNQPDALSLMYLFISPHYVFRTAQCSSSGDQLY